MTRPRPGDAGFIPPRANPDVGVPPGSALNPPGAPRPTPAPDTTIPRPGPDVTPAPVPAPITQPSAPRQPGADAPDVPRNPGVDAPDLPPGQNRTGNPNGPDAPPVPPGRPAGDASAAAPPPTLAQRARNAAAGLVPSVGIGVGLTALTMFIQSSAQVAMAAVGADAGLKALESILEFLGEPVNLAIVSGVVVVILMPKSK